VYKEIDVFGNQLGTTMHGRMLKMCVLCGALAADTLKHTSFHNSLINKENEGV
jgi:hypothetical protein